jgi:hypothetical protein
MGFQGELTDTEVLAKRHMTKLISELQKGIFSEAKLDLAYTNPDEFLAEYLPAHLEDEVRREVIGIIKHTIITGFFRMTVRRARAEKAEEN